MAVHITSSFLERRKKMMQAWTDYLDELPLDQSATSHRRPTRPRRAE
jgi:hypothetical protein